MSSISSASKAYDLPSAVEPAREGPISRAVSRNYSFAKVVAILTVTTGHWFSGTVLWIPVTFGLFVFAFSSGYFTSALYGENVDRGQFWRKKLERLGVRYWIILAFISALLFWSDKPIWHWHSLVHLSGMSGVLNWAGIPNRSALGAGLWFFTLLLAFYLSYPYLARLARSSAAAGGLVVGGFVLAVILEENIKVGHELWLTAFGFIAGVAWGIHRPRLSAFLMFVLTALLWSALLVLNLAGYKSLNTVLVAAGAFSVAIWLTVAQLPDWEVIKWVAKLDKYLLEIFLVHTYLFIRPVKHDLIDFSISLCLILLVSLALGWIADRITACLFDHRARAVHPSVG